MSREQRSSTQPPRAADRQMRAPGVPGTSDVAAEDVAEVEEEGAPAAPWHFKVLLVGTAGYLVYRLIWLIFWATGHGWHG